MKLKTLKDFPVCLIDIKMNPKDEPKLEHGVTIKELRQEVIKHIKKLSEPIEIQIPCPENRTGCLVYHYKEIINVNNLITINWIKDFFNITEEDLKC